MKLILQVSVTNDKDEYHIQVKEDVKVEFTHSGDCTSVADFVRLLMSEYKSGLEHVVAHCKYESSKEWDDSFENYK